MALSRYVFRQLVHLPTSTYTYLLGCPKTREAILVDPVLDCEERDLRIASQMDLNVTSVLDTHSHADHVTAAKMLKTLKSDIVSISPDRLAKSDRHVSEGDVIEVGSEVRLRCITTPGHTDGCCSYVTDPEQSMVFTGDSLLIGGCGRTDFQEGRSSKLFHSVRDKLFKLPDECLVFPGHNYVGELWSTIGEEKKYNDRLKEGITEDEFVNVIMEGVHKRLRVPPLLTYCVTSNREGGLLEHHDAYMELYHSGKK